MADSIQQRFEAFHLKNPHVYTHLVGLARTWSNAGNKVVGMKMLFEVLRWDTGLKTKGETYKLSNNFTSRYARLIHEQEPDLNGLFRTKELQAD